MKFIKQNPVLCYYLMVFIISWGGMLWLMGGPQNIPGTKDVAEKMFFPVLLMMFAGPFLSGILMNWLVDGGSGLRKYLARLFHGKVSFNWYVIAILTGPVLVALVLFGLTWFNHSFLPGIVTNPNKISSIIFGVSWGLIGGGFLEETGWTGFATPQLRKKYSILTTGLIIGFLWGLWHYMIAFWAGNYMKGDELWVWYILGFLAFYTIALPAYRVLLVLVFEKTDSLLIVMLMHAFLSASTIIFQPTTIGIYSLIWNALLGIVFWIIIAIIAFRKPGLLTKVE